MTTGRGGVNETGRVVYLDHLRAFAIIMVVILHSISYAAEAHGYGTMLSTRIHLFCYYTSRPLFFIIAGYFCRKQNIRHFLWKRFRVLIIPYWFFAAVKLIALHATQSGLAHAGTLPEQIYDGYVLGNLYWFPYALFVVQLLFPLVAEEENAEGFQRKPVRAVCALVVLTAVNCVLSAAGVVSLDAADPFQLLGALEFAPFFLLGYLFRYRRKALRGFLDKRKRVLLPAAAAVTILILVAERGWETDWAYPVTIPFAICAAYLCYSAARAIPDNRVLAAIGRNTWPIHFLDPFIKVGLYLVVAAVLPVRLPVVLLIAACDVLIGLLISQIAGKIPGLRTLFGIAPPSVPSPDNLV